MTDLGFWTLAQNDPNYLAVVDPEGRKTSRGELLAASNRIVHGLRAMGLSKGDGVAVVLSNELAFLEIYFATMQAGMYFTTINYHLTGPEIAYILEDCEAKVLITGSRFADATAKAVAEIGFPKEATFITGDTAAGFRPYAEIGAGQSDAMPEDRSAGQQMLYTSGTTGRPKGVRRALTGMDPDAGASLSALLGTLFDIPVGPGAHLVAGPLYHAAPLAFGTGAIHLGQSAVLMEKWTPEGTLKLIQEHGITTSHMVPTMFHRMLALPDEVKNSYDLSSLITVIHAAAPCPVDVKQKMIKWFGPKIYEYYAATEGGGTMVKPLDWLDHPGTVGQPWPGSQITIFNDDGVECPPNEPGTVYMGFGIGEFEYFKDKEKTDASRKHGMFTVGDIGYLDDDGWLFLCDRKADMIISGGVNIYPAEVEAVLLTHPKVGDAAVLGVPNEEWGEEVKAVIEPAADIAPSDELAKELDAFCREKLAGFKCPRSIDFRDQLPRLDTGKLYKRVLRDEYWAGHEKRI